MAWNRPSNDGRANTLGSPRRGRTPRPTARGAIAGVVVVLGAAVAAWWIFGNGPAPVCEGADRTAVKHIKEVAPAVTTKTAQKPKEKSFKDMSNDEKLKYYQEKYGDNPPRGIKQVMYFLKNPPKRGFKSKGSTDYLRHSSERYLAGVVLPEPGTRFFVEPRVDPSFDRDFAVALQTPIEVNDDDTPEIADSKRAIEDVKKEIAAISKETGRKPSEIVYEHATAMYKLGQYQQELQEQVKKIRDNPDYSNEDVIDCVKAVNEMLKSKGIAEMPLPNVSRRAFQLQRNRRLEQIRKEKEKKAEKSKGESE